jgi:hypothetical protein
MSLLSIPWRPRRSALVVRRHLLVFAALAVPLSIVSAQAKRAMPDSLTNREFWQFFTSMSEVGGSFPSENFISNELTYQHVIPTLQRSLSPGGVYLGVGPEQNFTYIANLKPRMAVIFDIRRQNAMAHLMYKALFELSPTRAEFVSRLFSRPLSKPLASTVDAGELFAAVLAASPSDSAFDANRRAILDQLAVKHGFELSPDDRSSITHVFAAFFEAGPNINYGYRPGMSVSFPSAFRSGYPAFWQLQTLTNADGVNMAFLATEANYQAIRALERKNLIVPVVGDFAGPKAIRGVGEYIKQHRGTVSAFYLSNVEQYLFRQFGDAEKFYKNVQTLPIDSTSAFIRSVPPSYGGQFGPAMSLVQSGGPMGSNYSIRIFDSAGKSVIYTTTTDRTGKTTNTRTVDSTGSPRMNASDVLRALRARDDSIARARMDSVGRAQLTSVPLPSLASGMSPTAIAFMRDSLIVKRDSSWRVPVLPTFMVGGSTLVSGIASIRAMLDAFDQGLLRAYPDAIGMTKTSGWK